ncbi:hypothetical protein BsWGS_24147 [Bradybaena similaris]
MLQHRLYTCNTSALQNAKTSQPSVHKIRVFLCQQFGLDLRRPCLCGGVQRGGDDCTAASGINRAATSYLIIPIKRYYWKITLGDWNHEFGLGHTSTSKSRPRASSN